MSPERRLLLQCFFKAKEILLGHGVDDSKLNICGRSLQIYTRDHETIGQADYKKKSWVWHRAACAAVGAEAAADIDVRQQIL